MKGAAWRETSMVMLAQAVAASSKDDESSVAAEGGKAAQRKAEHVGYKRRMLSRIGMRHVRVKKAPPSTTVLQSVGGDVTSASDVAVDIEGAAEEW